ncbi:MAG: Mur ligase family protein [Patescibacteria group bacterium]|jgi:UDP-N-acetylmuramate--alanine ligase|nr:Mur ligase family protein [Patescibacteria group bacterium]
MKHIYFLGIGGAGITPLALLAKQAGFKVSGSDKQNSKNVIYLRNNGIKNIDLGDTLKSLRITQQKQKIDWIVYSSALPLENPDFPEEKFAITNNIKITKRDQFISYFIQLKKLKLIAIAGTHGKTTTTAMLLWLFKVLGISVSYLLPASVNFADQAEYNPKSEYFIYEADEFDRNFLTFSPTLSLISGLSWDHHEIYNTREEYKEAFRTFIESSQTSIIWEDDFKYLGIIQKPNIQIVKINQKTLDQIKLLGKYNRMDAYLTIKAIHKLFRINQTKLFGLVGNFPGLQRRMEELIPNLYTDYAHTPEKIKAVLNVATEMTTKTKQKIVLIYEPLTNRRQYYIKEQYKDLFQGVDRLYWVDSYLAREDPTMKILSPDELIKYMDNPSIAEPAKINATLKSKIQNHLDRNDLVLAISGGGGDSLDEWLRKEFSS